ncbi:MAG: FkbM family methyltransferase [Candidatus Dormibacteraceae bacterium]
MWELTSAPTLVFCASLGAQVIAFEPASDTAELLRENVALNGLQIEVIEAAVGNKCGEVGFTVGQQAVAKSRWSGQRPGLL